jgi:demethylmenaquinone methyltransferase/2-methoxy-6-polyprenyl-1,4-benzoquinol methylase
MKNIKQSEIDLVAKVFSDVFDKYDLMNDIMSLGIHRIWKKNMIHWMNPQKGNHLIDVASGTGDIAKSFLERIKFEGKVTCVEPNELMLKSGKNKLKDLNKIQWVCAGAEKLPLEDKTFDLYSVSFGIRNFSNINQSLKEAKRVLKTGGRIFCLEFSKVENEILKKLYRTYSKSIPYIGKYVTGKSEPYRYLVDSIDKFYHQEELSEIFRKNGFEKVEYRNLSGGIVAIHSGWKI